MSENQSTDSGRGKMIWYVGVLGFGVGVGTLGTVNLHREEYGLSWESLFSAQFFLRWLINLVFFIPGGYVFGLVASKLAHTDHTKNS